MPIRTIAAAVYALVLFSATYAQADGGSYTDLDYAACRKLVDEESSVTLQCDGLKGYPVHAKEADLRRSTFFGPVKRSYVDNAFESFAPFNRTATRIEWRMDEGGRPLGAILRYFVENPDPDTGVSTAALEGQVLVISRVAQPEDGLGCVVAYVDALANPDADNLARNIADELASSFACGRDRPVYHGTRGPKAADPTLHLPK